MTDKTSTKANKCEQGLSKEQVINSAAKQYTHLFSKEWDEAIYKALRGKK